MFSKVAMISVPVKDQKAATKFYVDVLGCTVIADTPFGESARWIQLKLPGAETALTLVNWFRQMPPGSLQGVVLHTADIDAAARTLRGRGLEVSEIKSQPYGREATFRDPDGNGWVLIQPAPRG